VFYPSYLSCPSFCVVFVRFSGLVKKLKESDESHLKKSFGFKLVGGYEVGYNQIGEGFGVEDYQGYVAIVSFYFSSSSSLLACP
jgi:cytochrome oxidase Cu insertion factor (SCO1/SenC/PrrC family)